MAAISRPMVRNSKAFRISSTRRQKVIRCWRVRLGHGAVDAVIADQYPGNDDGDGTGDLEQSGQAIGAGREREGDNQLDIVIVDIADQQQGE